MQELESVCDVTHIVVDGVVIARGVALIVWCVVQCGAWWWDRGSSGAVCGGLVWRAAADGLVS